VGFVIEASLYCAIEREIGPWTTVREDRSEPLLAGVVERLGAGGKRSFTDGEELLPLLGG
jgi:hypothetical protein